MKKKPRGGRTKKPRGKMGHLQLGSAKDPDSVEFVPIELPRSKPEIEQWILAAALSAAGKAMLKPYDLTGEPVQNPEQDFDFTLPTPRGAEFLDLVELAPLQALAGRYDNARSAYRIGDIAEQAYRHIRAKSDHYRAVNSSCTMHLLAYTTDWRLRLPEPAQNLIRSWLSTEPHGFRTFAISRQTPRLTARSVSCTRRPTLRSRASTKPTWRTRPSFQLTCQLRLSCRTGRSNSGCRHCSRRSQANRSA